MFTVLKRATTIKRRGQLGEEQYGDISSVGEWESGQARKYWRIKSKASAEPDAPVAVDLR